MITCPRRIVTQVNTHDHTVYVGATGKDEMCNFYLMYWVQGGKPITPNVCMTQVSGERGSATKVQTTVHLPGPN